MLNIKQIFLCKLDHKKYFGHSLIERKGFIHSKFVDLFTLDDLSDLKICKFYDHLEFVNMEKLYKFEYNLCIRVCEHRECGVKSKRTITFC